MRVRRKATVMWVMCALIWGASVSAGERVQFKGSTSISLPKPTRSLEDARTIPLPDSPSGQGEYDAGMAAGTATTTTPQMDKKMKEFLDKKKNWIFVNPYENNYDAKTEEFMEGEKGTGLYEHRLMKEEEKGVMEKYLEERSPYREDEGGPESRSRETERGHNGEPQRPNDRANERTSERPEPVANSLGVQKPVEKGFTFSIDQKAPSLFGNTSVFDQKPERGAFNDRAPTFTERPDTMSKEEMRKERDTRDAEITRMIKPRGPSAGVASRLQPVNSSADSSRQEANPVGGRRTESFLNPNRPSAAVGGISGSGNSPIFSSPARSSSFTPRSGVDFGPKASSSPGNSFGGSSVSSPITAPRPTVNQQPFVLPRQQRKF